MAAKRLTARGLRELVKEEFSRVRGRRLNESLMARPEVDEAISTLADVVIEAMIEDEMATENEMDELRTDLMNELGECITNFVYE